MTDTGRVIWEVSSPIYGRRGPQWYKTTFLKKDLLGVPYYYRVVLENRVNGPNTAYLRVWWTDTRFPMRVRGVKRHFKGKGAFYQAKRWLWGWVENPPLYLKTFNRTVFRHGVDEYIPEDLTIVEPRHD